jgi:hypothetical protein
MPAVSPSIILGPDPPPQGPHLVLRGDRSSMEGGAMRAPGKQITKGGV